MDTSEQQQCVKQAMILERQLDIQDRKYHLRHYKQCFVGTAAIATMIRLKLASNEHEAIALGNKLVRLGIIAHVEQKHVFKNERLFYAFVPGYDQPKKTQTQTQTEEGSNDSKTAKHRSKKSTSKHHKARHSRHSDSASAAHAPLLLFPYWWDKHKGADSKCAENRQFHGKAKAIPPRITLQHATEHLLSPTKCSKRYLSAFCLNLHQLTSPEELMAAIVRKCSPVVRQLTHIIHEPEENSRNIGATQSIQHIEPSISASMPPSPLGSPGPETLRIGSLSPTTPLEVIPSDTAHCRAHSHILDLSHLATDTKHIANSHPTHSSQLHSPSHNSVPQSTLESVETRSCPDLDTSYAHHSDGADTDHSAHSTHSTSTPQIQSQSQTDECSGNIPSTDSISPVTSAESAENVQSTAESSGMAAKPKKTYSTKMRAYCIATLKHNIDLLYHWVYYYPSDFSDHALLDAMFAFIQRLRDELPSLSSITRRWSKLVQLIAHRKQQGRMAHTSVLSCSISNLRVSPKVRRHGKGRTSFQFTDSFFPPREMVAKLGGAADLLQLHPLIVAEQLTLIDTEIFLQIKPREFTNRAWQHRPDLTSAELLRDDGVDDAEKSFEVYERLQRQKIDAPNLLYMIDHVNRLSLWVATEILSRSSSAEMADLTKYFYHVAHRCLEVCNLHTCTAIFGGLSLQSITRLRRLNRYLADDEQIQTLHRALSEMVSSNHNYKTYRSFMSEWYQLADGEKRPCMPFIPVLMKDLFQIQLAMVQRCGGGDEEEKEDDKYVDLGLLEKNCRHIRRVYECQQKAKLYANTLPKDTDIQSRLRMNIAKFETHEMLRKWSFEIQPKLTKEDKENLEMIDTLEEFGFL